LDHHHVAVSGGLVNAEVTLGRRVENFKNTSVLVLGLGASGLAMARWCARLQAKVTVVDTRAQPPGLQALHQEWPDVQFKHVNAFAAELVQGSDIRAVCRSPGLSPAQIAPVLDAARASGVPVWGELDLFWMALQELKATQTYSPKLLAVTGTNGKTTVTALTGQLVARAGKTVAVAGNIGPTLLDTLHSYLQSQSDENRLPDVWVLELSSFQLEGVQDFMPTMGVVLNLTQDHLDWHGDMAAYAAAKSRIFGTHAPGVPAMLLNRDAAAVMAMRPALVKGKPQRDDISFGADLPQRPGDYGLESVGGMTWLVRALEADETQKRRKGDEPEIHLQRLMPADALRIRGRHNAMNALAALALACAAGCSLSAMLYGLREYRGEPHRVEPVAIVEEVEYFDDSKGTNVGATVAALMGLGADRKLVVILGGEGKGQDFSPLAQPIAMYARAVILIGRDAPLIGQALQSTGVSLLHAQSMEEAVELGARQALAGDAVLLSPACASFDMFRDYEHRAQLFRAAVQTRADAVGVLLGVVHE
jgi:UDP-N-acetylmuramoylalanine--D-glutamate ligase